MAYSQEEIDKIFNNIIFRIENGEPLRRILTDEGMPSTQTFYVWLNDSDDKSKRYAGACDIRAEVIFEDILNIADDVSKDYLKRDGVEVVNQEAIQRSRLRVDARKWVVAKLNPKKYGDKVDVTSGNEKIQQIEPVTFKLSK